MMVPRIILETFSGPVDRKILQVYHVCERVPLASGGGLECFQGNIHQ